MVNCRERKVSLYPFWRLIMIKQGGFRTDFLILVAAFVLSGCGRLGNNTESDQDFVKQKIVGLGSGEGVTFTRSPDGSAISLLYDNFDVRIPAADATKPSGGKTQTRRFTLVSGQVPASLAVWLRGYHNAAPGSSKLLVKAGKYTHAIELGRDEDGLVECVLITPTEHVTAFSIIASLQPDKSRDGQISIDTIDIAATGKVTAGTKEERCPSALPAPARQNGG
jgi:hypothetical protein